MFETDLPQTYQHGLLPGATVLHLKLMSSIPVVVLVVTVRHQLGVCFTLELATACSGDELQTSDDIYILVDNCKETKIQKVSSFYQPVMQ